MSYTYQKIARGLYLLKKEQVILEFLAAIQLDVLKARGQMHSWSLSGEEWYFTTMFKETGTQWGLTWMRPCPRLWDNWNYFLDLKRCIIWRRDSSSSFSFYSLRTANLQAIASINGYSYMYFALVFTLSSFLKDFDHLLMVQTIERLLLAKQSLISLIELLDDVKNMVINDHIQHEVCVLLLLLNPLSQVMESLSQLNKVQ